MRSARSDSAYTTPESALYAPSDETCINEVLQRIEPLRPTLRTVVLVGIGGSDLGTRAIYDACIGHRAQYAPQDTPTLLTFGTIESSVIGAIEDIFARHESAKEIALVVISKSGTTSETLVNAHLLFSQFKARFGVEHASAQTIVISDEASPLAQIAKDMHMMHFSMPKAVGGRYSIFTAVGLVPLALCGIDIRALCKGAEYGTDVAIQEEGGGVGETLAGLLFDAYLQGITMHEMFLWHPELEMLGKWYRQLLAESIGKHRADGTTVGITPTVALGSIDLHSHGQLVFSGLATRFTTFVVAPGVWDTLPLLNDTETPFTLPMLQGKSAGQVMRAIYEGVRTTYGTHALPYVCIELDALNEYELGAYMGVHMASVMYLASLLDVNAFDQPDVEYYKKETRRLLDSEELPQ
jgi:glucose-6-phosphate isomerase